MNTTKFESRVTVESTGKLSLDALKVISLHHEFRVAVGTGKTKLERVLLVCEASSYRLVNTHTVHLCRELRANGYKVFPSDIKSVGVAGAV